jgi:hypothetical protein
MLPAGLFLHLSSCVECLFYTWGNATITDNIELGGVAFAVTTNLLSAWQHQRLPAQPQRLWVDAICIDQSSIPERESQVRPMRKIYQNATRVVVWLGNSTPASAVAFTYLRTMENVGVAESRKINRAQTLAETLREQDILRRHVENRP